MTDALGVLAHMEAQFTPPAPPPCPAWCCLPGGHAYDAISGTASRVHFSNTAGWGVGQPEMWDPVNGLSLEPIELLSPEGNVPDVDALRASLAQATAVLTLYEAIVGG